VNVPEAPFLRAYGTFTPGQGRLGPRGLTADRVRLSRKAGLLVAGGLACVLVAAVTLVLLPGGSRGAGPVTTLMAGGRPFIETSSGPTRPGQEYNATAFVVSSVHDRVTLLSASLVPVRGEPDARFLHAGVYLTRSYDAGHATDAWPPRGDRVRPLRGARIGHGQTDILYAMTGPGSPYGYTMTAGITVSYRWRNQRYTVTAWSAAVACGDKLSFGRCGQLFSKAQDLVARQAG
jgi:hypothetical protein